jgi:transposase
MEKAKATIIGIDLAKRVFQVHAAAKDGRPVLRKKVSRAQLLGFLTKQPRAIVAMEACATAHEWGRAISGLGHEVRLIPPIYVKPFVRRQEERCSGRRSDRRGGGLKANDALCGAED